MSNRKGRLGHEAGSWDWPRRWLEVRRAGEGSLGLYKHSSEPGILNDAVSPGINNQPCGCQRGPSNPCQCLYWLVNFLLNRPRPGRGEGSQAREEVGERRPGRLACQADALISDSRSKQVVLSRTLRVNRLSQPGIPLGYNQP